MYDARFGTLVPKWTSAPANQFDTAFPFQRVMLPLRPLARITPLFGDPVGRRSKQSFRVVPGSVASLSKSPVVSNVGYSLPPAPSIVVSEFPLFPPSSECVVPDFFLSRLGTPSLCICVASWCACRCASVEYESALDFRPR